MEEENSCAIRLNLAASPADDQCCYIAALYKTGTKPEQSHLSTREACYPFGLSSEDSVTPKSTYNRGGHIQVA